MVITDTMIFSYDEFLIGPLKPQFMENLIQKAIFQNPKK